MSRRLRRPPRMRSRLSVVPRGGDSGARAPADDNRPRLRARGAPDLLALLPYQLGYHPSESVVAVFVRARQIRLTARVDLLAPESAGAYAADLRNLARQHQVDEIVLFAYSADAAPARALLTGLIAALPRRLVHEALYVDGARWWSMTCDDACCPAEGTPYDVGGHRLAAEAVFAGLSVRGSRAELAAGFAGPADDLNRLSALADRARLAVAELAPDAAAARLVELVRAGAIGLGDEGCAELAALVVDLGRRDLAWAMITPADAEQHLALWQRVVSRISPTISAAPLALSGMAGWLSGNGAVLNCAADELARRHPGYSMGELLATISERAVPPGLWDTLGGKVHSGLRQEVERLAGRTVPGAGPESLAGRDGCG